MIDHRDIERQMRPISREQLEQEHSEVTVTRRGIYAIYSINEYQMYFGVRSRREDGIVKPDFVLPRSHTYIFADDEMIAEFMLDETSVMDHLFAADLQRLQQMIHSERLDVTDVWRVLNPFWALWQFTDDEQEEEKYGKLMHERMDLIARTGAEDLLLYIEDSYVREDYKIHDIIDMYLDVMKERYGDSILCIDAETGIMEVSGTVSDSKHIYYMPDKWRELLKDDGDLVALGKAKEKDYLRNLI